MLEGVIEAENFFEEDGDRCVWPTHLGSGEFVDPDKRRVGDAPGREAGKCAFEHDPDDGSREDRCGEQDVLASPEIDESFHI